MINAALSYDLTSFIMYERLTIAIETKWHMFTWKFKLRKHIGHKAFKYEGEWFNVTFSQWDMGYFCCVCVCVWGGGGWRGAAMWDRM